MDYFIVFKSIDGISFQGFKGRFGDGSGDGLINDIFCWQTILRSKYAILQPA